MKRGQEQVEEDLARSFFFPDPKTCDTALVAAVYPPLHHNSLQWLCPRQGASPTPPFPNGISP